MCVRVRAVAQEREREREAERLNASVCHEVKTRKVLKNFRRTVFSSSTSGLVTLVVFFVVWSPKLIITQPNVHRHTSVIKKHR